MPGINMMPSGSTLQIPLDACTNFASEAGNAQVTLTWTDPKDKYATPEGETAQDPDQLVSVWEYTQIIRKTGSQPTGPHDGELVVSSSVRNQYQTTGFTDTGLTNDTTYYYGVFAYNKDGVPSAGAFTSAMPQAGTPLSSLAEGTIIKINENGSPVEFYLAKHNYEPGLNGQGRELVVRKDVRENRAWDATNVNAYSSSDIDAWCNGNYKALFSSALQSLIGTTKFYFTPGDGNRVVSTLERSIFIMSGTELGKSKGGMNREGSTLPIAQTLETISGNATSQWTRSPLVYDPGSGLEDYQSVCYWRNDNQFLAMSCRYPGGYRPIFTLPSSALVDQDLNLIETAVQTTALSAA